MKRSLMLFMVILSVLILKNSSIAGGLGIAIPFGFGSTDYDLYQADASKFGVNFIFDTNVAKKSLFNYRLNAGVEFFSHEYSMTDDYGYLYSYTEHNEGIRIVTDHTFGFGIVKSSVVRLWMGPNVRVGFVAADESGICLGAGITALGLNFNFGPVFTLGLEVGYQYYADLYFDDVVSNEYEDYSDYYQGSSTGLNNIFSVKLSFLFRIHDTYEDF